MSGGLSVPPDLLERLLLDRAIDFSRIISAISIVGLVTLVLLFVDFFQDEGPLLRNSILLALAALYFVILAQGHGWRRRKRAVVEDAKVYIGRTRILLVLLGLLWGGLITLLIHDGNDSQRALIYGIAVGCVATPVLVFPVSCAIAYWLPVSIGVCFSLLINYSLYAMLDLLSFIALTGFCILYLNHRMNERAINALRLEESSEVIKLLLRDFEESASDWLWETNAALELQQVSKRLAQVARRPAAALRGTFPDILLGGKASTERTPGSPVDRLLSAIENRSLFRDLVVPVAIDGEERFWSLTGKPILDKCGNFIGYHGVGSDITGQRRQQEQIAFLARHDSLTKLPNRMLFNEILHQSCERAEETGLALLCLDLDQFKTVNDTLGHATGDGMLVAVGERLRGCIRDADVGARLGGDEFAIILYTRDLQEISAVAARLVERITRPYHFDGRLVQIGVSIGITLAPQDGKTPSALMKNADLALYRAKEDGRGVWRFYDPQMDERVQERRTLQSALRQALSRREFRLMYQPIIDFAERRIVGAEALVRWQHPERGLLGPGEFIALAEECGLIGELGAWVLREACQEAARWPGHISVAVNLSPLQFRDSSLVETISAALSGSGLPPNRLELEITETTMLETTRTTVDALWALHDQGVRIALDDFGTGYSSLSYLRRFPFDKIKIDSSFIHDLGYEKDDSSIILAIIGLAERMNMLVTAEGVETAEQAELLNAYGCSQAQGYLFHRPLLPAAFAETVSTARDYTWDANPTFAPRVVAR
ncbi:MAG TPA: EAL domain-containing protein [Acidocella sp.]|nr:EAL domain-containing protein [Acidocella sp.]